MLPNPVAESMFFEMRNAEGIRRCANHRLVLLVSGQRKSLVSVVLLGLAQWLMRLGRYIERHLEDQDVGHEQATLNTERMFHSH